MKTKVQPGAEPDAVEPLDRMKVEQAAKYLGLAEQTLSNMRIQGRGPRYLKLGSRVFYTRADLDQYLRASIVETKDSRQKVAA
ncbi:helix-turn-helix domain-containing protein [Lysobacter firmicutimachus]|uniref:Helix-turn-helix domain-containing protein n=1 Tax=Lysobacter firmicutimachus TaxID=1792846 RepID=A0AAU8N026_9GAMM